MSNSPFTSANFRKYPTHLEYLGRLTVEKHSEIISFGPIFILYSTSAWRARTGVLTNSPGRSPSALKSGTQDPVACSALKLHGQCIEVLSTRRLAMSVGSTVASKARSTRKLRENRKRSESQKAK
jgi:hypothetical protein